MELLGTYFSRLRQRSSLRWRGRVLEAVGQTIESAGPLCSVGECCEIIDGEGTRHLAEVIGFRGAQVLSMPLDSSDGIRYGDAVTGLGIMPHIEVGEALIGRVLNALGQPIDGGRRPQVSAAMPLDGNIPHPLERVAIRRPLGTGIRAIDGMLTVGRGQRVGIFGGSGVGKSTLIGMMTRNSEAEVIVVGLVGERGREVGEFLEESLGPEGRKRAVVLVSTSDQSPLLRMRAALAATCVAEWFAARGRHVLLVLDSLTRFAMAAREVGLAAGEPPTAKGYTPSVFHRLARLIERAGQFQKGSITAFYTVLMEGDDQQDPLVDAVRSFLDGHVVLSRTLAAEGWYPPIEVLDSISRLMPAVTTPEHRRSAAVVRRLLAAWARSEDLVRIGAYRQGSDPELDQAMRSRPAIRRYLEQDAAERVTFAEGRDRLLALARECGG
ncbi:FliI/YscN family ATPase [Paracidobacterium acidisoli]|uniref:FliI/YscN family ATPase n=1 Tax=Paracidobacterium acidisoli TaxID=2303751 RepID=A0A372ISD3_9BACT|nr:FliI/YscN family ATPase [Paracidobacterium acidisoli]MBT9330292.1 FliI/YscN family ATPase [Paracidobacterium acidisoli]